MNPTKDVGPRGPARAVAVVAAPGRARTRARTTTTCLWCRQPATWSWSLSEDTAPDPVDRLLDDECLVCADCQALTLAGDDAGLLDRVMALLAERVPFPYASAFVREQEAARLAHWLVRRTAFRPC